MKNKMTPTANIFSSSSQIFLFLDFKFFLVRFFVGFLFGDCIFFDLFAVIKIYFNAKLDK